MTDQVILVLGGDRTRSLFAPCNQNTTRVLLKAPHEGVPPGHVAFTEDQAPAKLSGECPPSGEAYIAWVTPDGQRDVSPGPLYSGRAQEIVARWNFYLCDVAKYFAIPEGKIDSWKDGTWTP